jgi:hypothetical protein
MTRHVILRLVPLFGLVATLTACPTAATHIPPVPKGGLSADEAQALQPSPTPLASGASPFIRPTLIQASPKDTPAPTAQPTPSPTAAPAASPSPAPSGSPVASPSPTPTPFGLLGPNVGPSPPPDPTARFFPSPGTF